MIPKEKAKELVIKYSYITGDLIYGFTYSKQCALIAVDEILKELLNDELFYFKTKVHYWQEVKQEIEKL
jgi:hypothetical protein